MAKESAVQTALRLPKDMHERLIKPDGEGLTAEIRKRVQASFDIEDGDPKLNLLVRLVTEFGRDLPILDNDLNNVLWYEDPYAFEVFKAGVSELLEYFRPEGPGKFFGAWKSSGDIAGEFRDPPDVVGRTLGRTIVQRLKRGW